MFHDFLKKKVFFENFQIFFVFELFSNFFQIFEKNLGRTAGGKLGENFWGGKLGKKIHIRGGKNQAGIMFRQEKFQNRSDFRRDCANGERRPGCLRKQGHESFAVGPETRFDRL